MADREGKRTAAIVLAAGKGKRMNSGIRKQYMLLDGRPLVYYSLKQFEQSAVSDIILVRRGREGILPERDRGAVWNR